MHFVIDANMPRSTAVRIQTQGHDATDVRDVGMGRADDAEIAAWAQGHDCAILSRDTDFGDVRNYPPKLYNGIVVLDLPNETLVESVLRVVEGLLRQTAVLDRLPGNLIIVQFGRIRFRAG